MVRIGERLRRVDDRVLGRPVPDRRSHGERLLRPRPAVWSRVGRLGYAAIVLGMLADLRWGGDNIPALAVMVALLVALFVLVAADERKRSRAFHNADG
jgi:hypothetical protein